MAINLSDLLVLQPRNAGLVVHVVVTLSQQVVLRLVDKHSLCEVLRDFDG